jgi:heme/copper-type cytochrome/quinol oxidase subunit 4
MRSGQRPACDFVLSVIPTTVPVHCLMERIAPAHADIEYVT